MATALGALQQANPPPQLEQDNGDGSEDTSNGSTIRRSKCYQGTPDSLTKINEVRVEKSGGTTKSFLFDCQGSSNCTRATELQKSSSQEDAGGVSQCLTGEDGYAFCTSTDHVYEETSKGELMHVFAGDHGALIYCSKNLFN